MGDMLDILLNNRSFIQIRGHIMSSRSNHLHASFIRPLKWLCPLKCMQKSMMNVDQPPEILVRKRRTQYLHVAGKNSKAYLVLVQN